MIASHNSNSTVNDTKVIGAVVTLYVTIFTQLVQTENALFMHKITRSGM